MCCASRPHGRTWCCVAPQSWGSAVPEMPSPRLLGCGTTVVVCGTGEHSVVGQGLRAVSENVNGIRVRSDAGQATPPSMGSMCGTELPGQRGALPLVELLGAQARSD